MTGLPPLSVALAPDTDQFARLLRILARHLSAAADEVEHLATPTSQDPVEP